LKLNLTITFRSVVALVIFLGFATLLSAANPAPFLQLKKWKIKA
jgi:hypothetical protein